MGRPVVQEWASGRRKKVPEFRAKRRRRRRPRIARHGVLAAVWAIITALFTIAWFTLGGALWFVAALFGGLAAVMSAIATFDPDDVVPTSKPTKAKSASPRGERRSSTAAVPTCTKTGRPTDVCGCPVKHVMSSRGAERYKRQVGDPIPGLPRGRRAATSRKAPTQ